MMRGKFSLRYTIGSRRASRQRTCAARVRYSKAAVSPDRTRAVKQVPRWSARQTTVAPQLYTDHDKKSPGALPSSGRLLAFWGERRGSAGRENILCIIIILPDYA